MKKSGRLFLFFILTLSVFAGCTANVEDTGTSEPIETADTTAPAAVSGVEVSCGNNSVFLSWRTPSDSDYYGARITFTPRVENVTQPIIVEGVADSISSLVVNGLKNGTSYTFYLVAVDTNQNKAEAVTVKAAPVSSADITPPAEVSGLYAKAGDGTVLLSWINPSDSDFYAVKLACVPAAGNLSSPVIVQSGAFGAMTFKVTGLENATEYTFTLQTLDTHLNFSEGAIKSATPAQDGEAPQNVTHLNASNTNGNILLTWTDSEDEDLYAYEISYAAENQNGVRAANYTPLAENTIVVAQGVESCMVSGLTSGTEYTFTVKSVDISGNKSNGVSVTATPEQMEESTPLRIELSMPEEMTNTSTVITIKITGPSEIKRVVYKKNGSESPAKLLADEDALVPVQVNAEDKTLWTFEVDERAYWTVAALDAMGRESTAQIYTCTIDKVPPAEVVGVHTTYIKSTNQVEIAWHDPASGTDEYDSPLDHVTVSYTIDGGTELYTAPNTAAKGEEVLLINDIDTGAEYYRFYIYTVDALGNKSTGIESKLYVLGINATADDVVSKMHQEFTQSTVINVTGEITEETLDEIFQAASEWEEGIDLILDLSSTTGITNFGAFIPSYGSEKLVSITLPNCTETIGAHAFSSYPNLTRIVIPEGVETIGESAFDQHLGLADVVLPQGLKTIGKNAFSSCERLVSITLPDTVETIGEEAFRNCSNLKEVKLGASLKAIDTWAFFNCKKLTSIEFPETIERIGWSAFEYTGLSSFSSMVFADTTSIWYTEYGIALGPMPIPDDYLKHTIYNDRYTGE